MPIIIALVVVLLFFIVVIANIKIVPQAHAFVLERLGAFHASWGTGLHVKIPFFDRIAKKVSLKEQVIDFPPQPVITKDNVTMQIDTVVYFQITDPKQMCIRDSTGAVEAAKDLNIVYAPGYSIESQEPQEELLAEAVKAAKEADCAVLFIGITDEMESEGFDRKNLKIPFGQQRLIEEVVKVQKNTIAVIHCGAPVEMPWLNDVKAVLYAYLGGEAVGSAVVDLLYGEKNPSGKLAETFPLRLEDNPSYLYYFGEGDLTEYREGIFVGYRYYDKKDMEVLFPFGYGLSYTEFAYSSLRLDRDSLKDTDSLHVSVKVKNIGNRTGKEIVQLYVQDNESSVIRPVKELKGFEKVELAPGEEKEVSFILDKRSFAYYNTEISDWDVETGDFTIKNVYKRQVRNAAGFLPVTPVFLWELPI